MGILLIVTMLLLSAFFSGSEIAFVSASRLKAEARASGDGFIARTVRSFLERPETFLITTLVGNNLALVLYSSLMALKLDAPLRLFWGSFVGNETAVDVATFAAQTIVASLFVLIVGEILPKTVFRRAANRAIFLIAVPLRISYYLLLPFNKVSGWVANGLVRLFGGKVTNARRLFRSEIEATIRESSQRGELDMDEQGSLLLSNVFRIGKLRVKDSMIPRTDIEAIEEEAGIEALRDRFSATGYSKLPVYRENIDNITGVVFAYDLFQNPSSVSDMVREVRFVPESKSARNLMAEFLEERVSIAIVIDEFGGTAGMVTIEDLIEELTGEIHDEFDTTEFVARGIDDRTVVASGRAEIADLRTRFGLELEEGDYETLAGFLLEQLGYIPVTNEECVIGRLRFVILKSRANRIDLVRIKRPPRAGQ